MPDDLHAHDILAWSEREAALLRRVARGERVNDIDWSNVIDEVESVGRSELRTCRSLLRQALIHLLKLRGWPGNAAAEHWRSEAAIFLVDAADSFSQSMRQSLDAADLYATARALVQATVIDGQTPADLPQACPFTLDELLAAGPPDVAGLLGKLA